MSEWTRVAEGEGERAALEALIGQGVELIGFLARTKIPTLCGVDVDDEQDLSGQRVVARGTLTRHEIAPPTLGAPISAGRGPGVYYSLRAPDGALAKAELWSVERGESDGVV